MRAAVLLASAFLAVAACSRAEQPVGEPADAPAAQAATKIGDFDLTQPIRVAGTEPFWTADFADGTITWKDNSDAMGDIATPRTGPAGTPAIAGNTAVYTTTLTDGTPLVVTLKAEACPDIGEETRALTATVKFGDSTWEACADARSVYPPEEPAT